MILLCQCLGPTSWARTIVVSDIDDTIRKSETLYAPGAFIGLIQPNVPAFEGINAYYWLLWSKRAEFLYVSSSYPEIYDARSWLMTNRFPFGDVVQRSRQKIFTEEEFDFKLQAIVNRLRTMNITENDEVYFFGDTSYIDEEVYQKAIKVLSLKNAQIFIRDVDGQSSFLLMTIPVKQTKGVRYFFTDDDLIDIHKPLFFKEAPVDLFWSSYRQYLTGEQVEKSLVFKREIMLLKTLCPDGKSDKFNCSIYAMVESNRLKNYLNLRFFPIKFKK